MKSVKRISALSGNRGIVSPEQQNVLKEIHDLPNSSGNSIDIVRFRLWVRFIKYLESDVKETWLRPVVSSGRTHMPESMMLLEGDTLE